jgi:uncharacterized protein YndB with AHSA1/START domain
MTKEGTLVHIEGRPALRFERHYPTPVERVWRAVTEPAEMAAWFPSNVEGARAVGAELVFTDDDQRAEAIEAGEPTRAEGPALRGRVVAYDPPNVFSFTWGTELLRFELTPEGDGTVLVFTQLLSHQSVAARNGAGWHDCLGALDDLMGAGAPDDAGWQEVYQDYLERIGPELGVPVDGGGLCWERATHVPPERVREATSSARELEAWGAADHAGEPLRWEVLATEAGTTYRLTHDAVDGDAERAATWHALLIQLDMYLAAGQLVPVDPGPWREAYGRLLR